MFPRRKNSGIIISISKKIRIIHPMFYFMMPPTHTCEYCCALVMKSLNLKSSEPIWPLKDLGYEAIMFENRNIKSLAIEREELMGCTKYGIKAGTSDIVAAVSRSAC